VVVLAVVKKESNGDAFWRWGLVAENQLRQHKKKNMKKGRAGESCNTNAN